ncbi:Cyclic nucleotide-gated channel rod photoreceptor subunit alpha [Exaiptasia diaphana]|nr:Cyclic nucleotide-gated channel rod photoreceptor subunit alpha [Exaiptasia diaphana]
MVFGKLMFGFILGNVASTLANAEIARVKYEDKLGAIEAHMSDQEIPLSLQKRVKNFYEFIWNTNKGVEYESLFHDMPHCMNGELCNALTGSIISNIPLFSDADLPFIRLLATKARPCQFHAKEYIFRKGDIGQEMYLIKKGLVEIVTEEQPPEVMETLEEGGFFGEKSLVISTPRNFSVRAATHADVFMLKKDDLDEALEYFADVKAKVSEKVNMLYGVHLQ